MKTEESFYIQILLWAYYRTAAGVGFTENELFDNFNLKNGNGEKYRLYLKLFRDGTNDNHPVIDHFRNEHTETGEVNYWCLSDKGIASAIDYIDLKETRESSAEAKKYATISIWISIILGIISICLVVFQILNTQDVNVTNLPITQKVDIQNEYLRTEAINLPKVQNFWVNNPK
jgi:hypothetical protein